LICTSCGLVLEDRFIDTGPDWRSFKEETRHTGPPVSETIHDLGISSRIDQKNRDALGRQLTPARAAVFGRLRKHDRRTHMANSERTLTRAFQEQARVCHNLGLPNSVRERAAFLFRKIAKERTLRGRPIEAVAAATIHLVCKEFGLERGANELVRESGVDPRDFKRAYGMLTRNFHVVPSLIEITYCVHDIVERLGLDENLLDATIRRLERRKALNKKQALEEAAAVIYSVCREARRPVTQARIAEAINFSRASFSKLLAHAPRSAEKS
jgi:transcription initiation factor TFIIB